MGHAVDMTSDMPMCARPTPHDYHQGLACLCPEERKTDINCNQLLDCLGQAKAQNGHGPVRRRTWATNCWPTLARLKRNADIPLGGRRMLGI